jgi:hypothetical protein
MRQIYYIEDEGGELVAVAGGITWAMWMATHDRRVALSELGGCEVSTAFLGIDHAWQGEPMLYETMVFGGALDGEMARYSTRAEALEGHERMVERVKEVVT